MTDPYRIDEHPAPTPTARSGEPGTVLRGLLWLVLVVSVVANSVSSVAGASTSVHLALGIATALCVAALIALRPRRSR